MVQARDARGRFKATSRRRNPTIVATGRRGSVTARFASRDGRYLVKRKNKQGQLVGARTGRGRPALKRDLSAAYRAINPSLSESQTRLENRIRRLKEIMRSAKASERAILKAELKRRTRAIRGVARNPAGSLSFQRARDSAEAKSLEGGVHYVNLNWNGRYTVSKRKNKLRSWKFVDGRQVGL